MLVNIFKISKINDCSLEKAGLLPHEFIHGSCGTFKFPEERVMFCFGYTSTEPNYAKKCFR